MYSFTHTQSQSLIGTNPFNWNKTRQHPPPIHNFIHISHTHSSPFQTSTWTLSPVLGDACDPFLSLQAVTSPKLDDRKRQIHYIWQHSKSLFFSSKTATKTHTHTNELILIARSQHLLQQVGLTTISTTHCYPKS